MLYLTKIKRNRGLLILGGSLIVVFVSLRTQINFPITLNEAKEGYTAYSLINTGRDTNNEFLPLLFRGDNDYLSTLAVYFRIPSVFLFDLSELGVRLPGLILGILTMGIFYLIVKEILKDKLKIYISLFLLAMSPIFITTNIFELGKTNSLLFSLLTFYLLTIKDRVNLFIITSILAVFSSFSALPFIISLILLKYYKAVVKNRFIITGVIFVILLGFIFSKNDFSYFLKRESFVQSILPSSYTHIIDKRLSFGLSYDSPLITKGFNFNRIAHNKLYYAANEVFRWMASLFDYEKYLFPFQAQTVLGKVVTSPRYLPKFFFWEIPVVLAGMLILKMPMLKKKRSTHLSILLTSGLSSALIFKDSLIYLLPIIIISETVFFAYLIVNITKRWYWLVASAVLLFVFSIASFVDLFWFHYDIWFDEQGLRQYQIWSTIEDKDLKENKVIITDRLGEPVYYYLFYEKVDPEFFSNHKIEGVITDEGTRRIEKVGDVEFRSFKYFESPRGANEVWVGMAGEFVGENKDFDKSSGIIDGEVIKEIEGVKQENKFIGDKLWFVRTNL